MVTPVQRMGTPKTPNQALEITRKGFPLVLLLNCIFLIGYLPETATSDTGLFCV